MTELWSFIEAGCNGKLRKQCLQYPLGCMKNAHITQKCDFYTHHKDRFLEFNNGHRIQRQGCPNSPVVSRIIQSSLNPVSLNEQ